MSLTAVEIRNPRWVDPEGTPNRRIDCEVTWDAYADEPFMPCTVAPAADPHLVIVYDRCIEGEAGLIATYVMPRPTTDQVNRERDRRLMVMTGTASATDAFYAVMRANSEASRLMNKELRKGQALTVAEAARATELEDRDAAVAALDDAAQAIRADIEAGTYSGDIATDPRWPV